jgi:hypothetical protein
MVRVAKSGISLFILAALLIAPRLALAHAILVTSTPAMHGSVHGPDVAIDLKFNSRVDGLRSRIFIVLPGGATQAVALDKQAAPERLLGHAQLNSGNYTLRWQALAADGHITRGEIPFTVQK